MVAKRYRFGGHNVNCTVTIDNRDYSIDRIRESTDYVERADFRVPAQHADTQKKAAQHKRQSSFWLWFIIAAVVLYLLAKLTVALLKR